MEENIIFGIKLIILDKVQKIAICSYRYLWRLLKPQWFRWFKKYKYVIVLEFFYLFTVSIRLRTNYLTIEEEQHLRQIELEETDQESSTLTKIKDESSNKVDQAESSTLTE